MRELKISEVSIEPVTNRNGLIGFASFLINDSFKILNVAIHTCLSSSHGIRLVFPQKKYDGRKLNTVYPISREAYEATVAVVSEEYQSIMERLRGDENGRNKNQ